MEGFVTYLVESHPPADEDDDFVTFINDVMVERGLKRIRIDNLGGVLFVGEALTEAEMKKLLDKAKDEGVSWVVVESYPVLTDYEAVQETAVLIGDRRETLDAYEGLIITLQSVGAAAGALEMAEQEYHELREGLAE